MTGERDFLLGSLLALDEAKRRIDDGMPTDPFVLAQIVRRLRRGSLFLGQHPQLGYGMPDWSTTAVHALIEEIKAAHAVWSPVLADLADRARRSPAEELEDLELLELELAEETPPPAWLQRREAVGDDLAAASSTAPFATPQDDPELIESEWRFRRTDVVLHRPGTSVATVVGMEVEFPEIPSSLAQWNPSGPESELPEGMHLSFVEGIFEGRDAALSLCHALAVPETVLRGLGIRPRIRIPGVLPPFTVSDKSAALAVALSVLREASRRTDVDFGPPRFVASGSFEREDDNVTMALRPMDSGIASCKLDAVRRDGRADKMIAKCPGVDGVVAVHNLAQAAEAAWGDRWRRWEALLADDALTAKSYRVSRGPQGFEPDLAAQHGVNEVTSDVAKTLMRRIAEAREPFAAILGGPANTGKTTIARQVAEQLSSVGWDVLWLALPGSPASSAEDLIQHIGLALRSMGDRTLIVIDDLDLGMIEHAELDDVLLKVVGELRCAALALANYRDVRGPRWKAERVITLRAISGTADVRRFASQLIEQNPVLAAAGPWASVAVQAASGDLWVLIEFIRWAAKLVEQGAEPDDRALANAFLADRFACLGQEERNEARMIAALSLVDCSRMELDRLAPEQLSELGGRRDAHGWRIRSRWMALRIARSRPADAEQMLSQEELERNVSGLLRRELEDMLEHTGTLDADRRIGRMLTGAECFSHTLVGLLLEEHVDRLVDWSARAHPAVVASFLDRNAFALDAQSRRKLVANLSRAVRLPVFLLDLGEAGAVLSVLARFADHIQAAELDGLEQALGAFLPGLLTEDTAFRPWHRLRLLAAVLRFRFKGRGALIRPNLVQFFYGLDPERGADYRAARAMIGLLLERREAWFDDVSLSRLMGEAEEGDEATQAVLHGDPERALLDMSDELRRMLAEPAPNAPVGVWLGWLSLCNGLRHDPGSTWGKGEWNDLIDVAEPHVRASISGATLDELWRAIADLKARDRGLCVRLLNRADLAPALVERFGASGTFGQRARFVGTVRTLHGMTARDLLYDGSQPRRGLAERFGDQARRSDDPRGVGLFLREASLVDETYGSTQSGFAHCMAERLGREYLRANLRRDERLSLLFYLVDGLARAHADYLEDAVDIALERITTTVQHTSRGWAPALALTLAAQDGVRQSFLPELAARIDRLPSRLRTTTEPQAVVYFHRLAAALDTADAPLARAFQDQLDVGWASSVLVAGRPEWVAQILSATTRTLQRAGEPDPATLVCDLLVKAGWDWTEECRNPRRPASVDHAIVHLCKLAPMVAHQVVRRLATPDRDETLSAAAQLVFDAARDDPVAGASMLGTLTRADASVGRSVLAEAQTRERAWRRLQDDLCYVQEPIKQAAAFRSLGLAEWSPDRRTVERVWDDRWSAGMRWLRNPRAITGLIRLFAGWEEGRLVGEAIDAVARGRVTDRILEGAAMDLDALPELLSVLRLAGRPEVAIEIASASLQPADFVRRAGVRSCGWLLRELRTLGVPSFIDELERHGAERLQQEIRRPARVYPIDHWLAIGTLAFHLGPTLAAEIDVPQDIDLRIPLHMLGPIAWGVGWLPPSPWRDQILNRAFEEARGGRAVARPWGWAAALAVLSAHGRVAEAAKWEIAWSRIVRAKPWILAVLLGEAEVNPRLTEFLLPLHDDLRAALSHFATGWHELDASARDALRAMSALSRAASRSAATG